jgi:LmbE family N-acetylglucosaminyl deacetylase
VARVLVLSPHPDDEAIGAGGTLRQHVENGDEIHVVFLTSGENGVRNQDANVTAAIREREAEAAAKTLGYKGFEFWRERDSALAPTDALCARLKALVEKWQPEAVYAPHEAEMHADHQTAFQLINRLFGEGRIVCPDVWLYEVWTPLQQINRVVDISKFVEVKIEAIRAYKSQCDIMRFDQAARALNRYRGEMHSWPGGPYAEVFRKL